VELKRFLNALAAPFAKILEREGDSLCLDETNIAIGFGIGMRADGSPSLLSKSVALRCAGLYDRGCVRMIIFTGGASEKSITEAEAMKRVALASGVPEDSILVEQYSRNTHQNALRVWAIIESKGLAKKILRFAIVGQYLHVGRCYDSVRRVFPKTSQICLLKAYSRYDTECTQKRLTAQWKFVPWEIIWTLLFKIKLIRRLIS
jgi:uncharacterized SAM-binding protein YcdF (DUF218 family)